MSLNVDWNPRRMLRNEEYSTTIESELEQKANLSPTPTVHDW